MIRTQVYLQDDQYQRIISLARSSSIPMAEIIRRALAKGLNIKKNNDLVDLAKLSLKGGPKNLSSKVDDYLYK